MKLNQETPYNNDSIDCTDPWVCIIFHEGYCTPIQNNIFYVS